MAAVDCTFKSPLLRNENLDTLPVVTFDAPVDR